jgi:hypothetical protein
MEKTIACEINHVVSDKMSYLIRFLLIEEFNTMHISLQATWAKSYKERIPLLIYFSLPKQYTLLKRRDLQGLIPLI